jgi:hypothetical protein
VIFDAGPWIRTTGSSQAFRKHHRLVPRLRDVTFAPKGSLCGIKAKVSRNKIAIEYRAARLSFGEKEQFEARIMYQETLNKKEYREHGKEMGI